MSEFLAEARILVRPDTTGFRAELEAALKAATATPITVPVVAAVTSTTVAGAAAASQAAAAAQTSVAAAAQAAGAEVTQAAAAEVKLAAASTEAAVSSGALSSALTSEAATSAALTQALNGVFVSTQRVAAVQAETAAAGNAFAASQLLAGRNAAGATKGIVAQGASLLGLRAGTLAASTAFIGGTVAVLAFSRAVQSAANLETELNVFKVTAGATADEMDRVSASAKQLGRDITLPGVTASTAATAMTELAKAGLSVQDSLAGARGALQLSTAAQIDVTAATNLVAGSLNAFALSGSDAVKVADLLTGAAKESQGEITDMGTALGQAAAVSHAFGVSIEDTVTLLTELAQAGISGGRAGTSLRVAFLRLVNPPKDAAAALKELNVQNKILNADGGLNVRIFGEIEKALEGYTAAQKNSIRATIFGADAIRTQAIIGAKGARAFDQTKDAITELGLAQQAAAARTSGLQGDMENLSNQVSSLGLTLGEVAKGPTSVFVKSLADIVTQINLVADGAVQLGANIKGVGSAFLGVIPGVNQLSVSFGDIVKATTFINPLTGQLAVLSKAMNVFGLGADDAAKKTAAFGGVADSVTKSVDGLAAALRGAAAGLKTQLPSDTGLGITQIQNIITGFDAKGVRDKIHKDNEQLVADLQAEQEFLRRQLERDFVKNRPALQRAIEAALLGTVNDIDAVQSKAESAAAALKAKAAKAASDAAAAVRDREQALLAQFGVAREQRQNTIDTDAQKGFLGKQIADEKGLRALVLQQIAAVKARISVEGGRAAAIAALRSILTQVDGEVKALREQQIQQQKELQASILETQLLRAQGTPGTEDDNRVLNKQIAAAQKELKAQQKIANNEKLGSKVRLDAALKVQEDVRKILTIRQSIKNLSGGGFSLSDLFKEAINQLNEFGSNVSTSPITPGGARAAVAGGILGQKTGLTDAEKASLNATAETNEILRQMLVAIGPPPNQAQGSPKKVFLVRESGGPEIGVATSVQQRRLGTFVGGV